MDKTLIIEPFYGGSHKQMIDILTSRLDQESYELITMSAKKWPWRARCSALYISQNIPESVNYNTVFCSSVLNLVELIGLCPKLRDSKKIIYFHENQLIYPVKVTKKRDFQFGYNQITSCLAADHVVFNSHFNMTSFLENIKKFLKLLPDYRPKLIKEQIEKKCFVLYFPLRFQVIDSLLTEKTKEEPRQLLHLVWAHRWEFDKNPGLFFDALYFLLDNSVPFEVSILGESFSEVPEEFEMAKKRLEKQIKNYGYAKSQEEFYRILMSADIVVSTADHEFFGVSMLEGVRCGCVPLAPNNLVYPELYPANCLYDSREELFSKLKNWCEHVEEFAFFKSSFNCVELTQKFDAENLIPQYLSLIDSSTHT